MLCYWQLDPSEQTSVRFQLKYKTFIHENASENIVYEIAANLPMEEELNLRDIFVLPDRSLWRFLF